MKKPQFIKNILNIGIVSSLAFILYSVPKVFERGAFFEELPYICLSMAIIISPYIYLLQRVKNLNDRLSSFINLFVTSMIVTFPAIIFIFMLIYVYPDAQNGVAVFGIVMAQWVLCLVSLAIEPLIGRK